MTSAATALSSEGSGLIGSDSVAAQLLHLCYVTSYLTDKFLKKEEDICVSEGEFPLVTMKEEALEHDD